MTRVRTLREQRAIPVGVLAQRAGISRQALSAIETGRASPSVAVALRLAAALSATVEELFGDAAVAPEDRLLLAHAHGLAVGSPVAVGCIDDRWFAHGLDSDAVTRALDGVAQAGKRVELCRPRNELVDTFFIAGCAPALGALAERAQRHSGTPFRWLSRSSADALRLLEEGRAHVGGVHLTSNEAAVRRHAPTGASTLITLARWEVGLVLPRGASAARHRTIRGVADLCRPKVRIAWREQGSGARAVATRLVESVGGTAAQVARHATELRSHLAVAQAVHAGFVDVGFTIRPAALAYGLDFIPQAEERFDLVVRTERLADRRMRALLDVVTDGGFRRELGVTGYDAAETGARTQVAPRMIALVLAGVLAAADPAGHVETAPVLVPALVAAAANLEAPFTELAAAFESEGHGKVLFTFGSSGLLAKQLKEGAPFDVLAAANAAFVDDVVKAGACDSSARTLYARGHIVVWTRKDATQTPPKDIRDLADTRFAHIAIANPEHAPYGVAAREALTAAGIWSKVEPRIVLGENVRHALQLAETGNADAAIVALSIALPATSGTFTPVDDAAHRPLDQALAVCVHGRARAAGEAFVRFVLSPRGRDVMTRDGFTPPAEPAAPPIVGTP